MDSAQMDWGYEAIVYIPVNAAADIGIDMLSHLALIEIAWSKGVAAPYTAANIIKKNCNSSMTPVQIVNTVCGYYINNTRSIWGNSYSQQIINNIRNLLITEYKDIMNTYFPNEPQQSF